MNFCPMAHGLFTAFSALDYSPPSGARWSELNLLVHGDKTMGTRSETIIIDGNKIICQIYRQYDGYPEGHGKDLAALCDLKIVNGFGDPKAKVANGFGCLAAQIIKGLKDGVGGVYLTQPDANPGEWTEYVYVVNGVKNDYPVIECHTNPTGAWPFNLQTENKSIFKGNAKDWKRWLKVQEIKEKAARKTA
jgi:hypothetical protein